jgi:hypothetical protein
MALPVSITLTILISHFFFYSKKTLSLLQNSIVFMVMAIITRNYVTIMTMQLKLLKSTEDYFLFLFLLMHREIIVPLLVLIFINNYLSSSCWNKKMFLFIGVLTIMIGMDHLLVYYKVIEYEKWNFIYAVIVDSAFLIIGIGVAKVLLFLHSWESLQDDSSL